MPSPWRDRRAKPQAGVRGDQAHVGYCDASDVEPYYKTKPCLVAEVLSPAPEAIHRREKWLAYRQAD